MFESSAPWRILPSLRARRTPNPLQHILDGFDRPSNHGADKPYLSLAMGDPAAFGNIPIPEQLVQETMKNVKSQRFNGYAPTSGRPEAKQALARYYSLPNNPLTPDVSIALPY